MTLLGGLSLTWDGEPIGRFISSKSPALLCYLAYTGQPHTRAALTGLLWGDSPEAQAKASLRQVLSDLRGRLAPYLLIEGGTVAFNAAAPHWLDVAEFNRHLQAAAPPDANAETMLSNSQAAALQAAADLYRGDFLAGFFVPSAPGFEEWVTGEQEWLRQAVLQALHRLILHYTQRGAYLLGINAAQRLLTLEPWQEEAHRQLMRLLALNGQRGAALAQYETCRRVLAKELGVGPTPATVTLYDQIRSGQVGVGRVAGIPELTSPTPNNLPVQTPPFIGREAELAQIMAHLGTGTCRAVTITGASGSGKTRLALAAADEVKTSYPQGIWYVPLTGILTNANDPGALGLAPLANGLASQLVVDEIATAMKLSFSYHADPTQQLIDHLRNKRVLLLLDGLKPILPPVAHFLARLLGEANGMTLLITAPGPIGLPGEHTLALGGLPTPDAASEARIRECASVRLFIERADRAANGFSPTPQDLPVIAEICRLMAGNPLGIELAAAWVEHWPPVEILSALRLALPDRDAPPGRGLQSAELVRPAFPTVETPITVEAAFQGRWDLLAPAERSALAQLTVFRGDFSEQAAEALTGASAETLAGLAERLLLQTPAPGRYAMHRLIQQFTVNRLPDAAALGERGSLAQDRHSAYFLGLLAQREASLHKRGMIRALAEIQTEWRHIQQAWEWAADRGDVERLQRTTNALARYISLRGLYQRGERLFGQAADALQAQSGPPAAAAGTAGLVSAMVRGQLLLNQARFLNLQANHERLAVVAQAARAQFEHTLAQARQEEIRELAVASLSNLGSIAVLQNDYSTAREHLEAALQLYEQMDEPLVEASLLSDLGAVMMLYGDYAAARSYLERSQQTCRQTSDRAGEGMACFNLGRVTDAIGAYDEARNYFEQALRISRSLNDERLEAQTLTAQGLMAHHMGDHNAAWEASDQAARLAAAANNRPAEAEALTVSGHALLGLGLTAEAATAYSRALEIYRALDQRTAALEPLAGLAQVALAHEKLSQAVAQVDEILRHIIPPKSKELTLAGLQGAREPFRVCLTCSRGLRAARNPRARDCEEAAYRLLKEQAERISDPAMRRAFMRQSPSHQEIIEAHRANRTSPWR
jgi:DNA-binding SARP family transcriptional activator/predicted ATPase/predicted HD phosphohydrolase